MPLFAEAVSNSRDFFEAKVLGVDAVRMVCKIQTTFGQAMQGVRWLSSLTDTPKFGDIVYVCVATGSPVILGVLPLADEDTEFAAIIDTGEVEADTGNYSSLGFGVVNDPNKPGDFLAGDKLLYNQAGGVVGLLRGGGFIAKASRLAQIFITKYDDLVRIVARNYELFTDVFTQVVANVRGRIYEYRGYSDSDTNVRGDVYKYDEAYGDTVLANLLKGNYYGSNPTAFALLAAPNDIIRKYRVLDASGNLLMKQELHLTGQYYTITQNSAGTTYTYVDQTIASFDIKTLNGTYTRITTTPTSVVVTYNGTNTLTIDSTKLKLDFGGTHTLTVDATGVHTT